MSKFLIFFKTTNRIFASYDFIDAVKLFYNYLYIIINNRLSAGEKNTEKLLFYSVTFPRRHLFFGQLSEIFFQRVYPVKKENCRLVIDCGSNIGMSVLYFKWRCPGATILCFEPNPEALVYLRQNIESNNLSDVKIFPFGLSRRQGVAPFHIERSVKASTGATFVHSKKTQQTHDSFVLVEIRPLSDFITTPVDFLKLDVEGSEVEVIEDLLETKKISLVKEMNIEYHFNKTTYPIKEFISLLEKEGFICYKYPSSMIYGNCNQEKMQTCIIHARRI